MSATRDQRAVPSPESASGNSGMIVFRDGTRTYSSGVRLRELQNNIAPLLLAELPSREAVVNALLAAGELECGLVDASSEAATLCAVLTDELAQAFVHYPSNATSSLHKLHKKLHDLLSASLPEEIKISVPEGFAYYALHPLDYVETLAAAGERREPAAVIGIRSIGTTLSAVVNAHFAVLGISSQRITVRPAGHPFDRVLQFDAEQKRWVDRFRERSATFYVVDEGPGMSGSSFLATAEALLREGVPSSKITLLCSTQPDLKALLAPQAAERWRRFRSLPAKTIRQLPARATRLFSAGEWREQCFHSKDEWPASWLQMERVKFLSEDTQDLFRFDGLGGYGRSVRARYQQVAEAGFGPACENAGDGFTRFAMLQGHCPQKVSASLVQRAADYCAFRASEVRAEVQSHSALQEMTRINIERELGWRILDSFRLEVARPVIADGKMMLHEWLQPANGGRPLKLDAAAHGDDHFLPGPTDIAWDLAGTIIEWRMDKDASASFLDLYCPASRDEVRPRLGPYLIAYAAFRMGYCKMAAMAMPGHEEERRMWREYKFYKDKLMGVARLQTAAYQE